MHSRETSLWLTVYKKIEKKKRKGPAIQDAGRKKAQKNNYLLLWEEDLKYMLDSWGNLASAPMRRKQVDFVEISDTQILTFLFFTPRITISLLFDLFVIFVVEQCELEVSSALAFTWLCINTLQPSHHSISPPTIMAMPLHHSLLPIVLLAFVSVCSSGRALPPFHHNGKPLPGAHPPTLPPPLQNPQPHFPSPLIHKPPLEKKPPMKDAHPPTFPNPQSPHASPLIPKPPYFHIPLPLSPANAPLYHKPGSPIFNGPGEAYPPLMKSPPKPTYYRKSAENI
ncbi:hypothetical protein SUGI_0436250 [Cryptomeria japonica]|nr:hypothetical protein SUGI_0436250 [Cryptomeria japonica]